MKGEVPVIENIEETYREDYLIINIWFYLIVIGTIDGEGAPTAKDIFIDDGWNLSSSNAGQEYHLGIAINIQISELQILLSEYLIRLQCKNYWCPIEPEGVTLSNAEIAVDIKSLCSKVDVDLVGLGDD